MTRMDSIHRNYIGAFFGGLLILAWTRVAVTSTSHLTTTGPAIAPFAHTVFCLKYPNDCKEKTKKDTIKSVFLTPKLRAELEGVNASVNQSITSQPQITDPAHEQWLIDPVAGDCNDYAVTKRHDLIQKGWPADALLLTEVELRSGEHHLVLVARTSEGDLVLDSLKSKVSSIVEATFDYTWLRMVSPQNPMFWTKVRKPT